ncbi:MAG: ATP-binding cassette domain-containing protein, partial [Lachnospiraceae bacterium]|nr:ATP-binding cassette domain-containing protein [Lachnospiraceae bacterium]
MYFLQGAKRYFALSLLFAAMVSLLDMISPKIISFTVDCVIGSAEPRLPAFGMKLVEWAGGIEVLRQHLPYLALAVALVGALAALARFLFRGCNARGAETFVERTRCELFRHIMDLPYVWHSENSTGDIIQRCTSDVQTIKRFISEQLVQLVRTVILILLALGFMAGIHWKVMMGSAVFIPMIVAYSLIFHTKIGPAFEKVDVAEGALSAIAQENLTGVRVVRAFGREIYERERFEKQNEYYTGFWVYLMRLLAMYWSTADILTGFQVLSVIVLGSVACIHGTLTAGGFIAMISYNMMLIWPVRQLGRVISELSKAGISIERLRYIMNSEPELDRADALEPPMNRDIVFDHVSFAYEHAPGEALHDISFTIPAGRTIGILGGTGSGKSTLMYLLERLYVLPPECGRITVGGVDIADIRLQHLRKNIGLVLQEPYLFSRTLSENIGIAVEKPQKKDIRRAAKAASIDDAISSFTAG